MSTIRLIYIILHILEIWLLFVAGKKMSKTTTSKEYWQKSLWAFVPYVFVLGLRFGHNIDWNYYCRAYARHQMMDWDITEPFVMERLHTILSRGHYVGFHPSENTFYNNIQFTSEVERLQSVLPSHIIKGGRNHGLFYGNETFTQWNSAHIEYDSGYGFQFYNGFRCGCCYPFRVFDLFERKTLSLLEIPFVCMDSVVIRNHFTPNQMFEDMKQVIDEVYKYQGTVCLNFHSNMINTLEFKKYKKIYIALVEYLSKLSNSK